MMSMLPRKKASGLWVPDRKLECPALFEPGVKPTCEVEIDESHWLADEFELCCIFNEPEPKDLAGRALTHERAYPLVPVAGNLTCDFTDDNADTHIVIDDPIVFAGDDSWTIVVRLESSGDINQNYLLGDETQTNSYLRFLDGSYIRFRSDNSDNDDATEITDFSSLKTFAIACEGGGLNASVMKYYENSILKTTHAANVNSGIVINSIGVGRPYDERYRFVGNVEYLYIIKGLLSAEQIANISADPYQFLVPK